MKHKFMARLIFLFGMTITFLSNAGIPVEDQKLWYYLSSHETNQVFRFQQDTGEVIGILDTKVPGPFASFVAVTGDYFVAAQETGEVYRFEGATGKLKDVFIKAGSGGLSRPTAPILTPDGKYLIVGDLDLNGYFRYNGQTGEFIDIFADSSTVNGPFMPVISPWPEYKGKIFIASGFTNSIQIYDIETKAYEGDFVKPGYGGLKVPIGLVFGPDGNLYTTTGDNSVKRYNGRTGEYIDDFVPSGSGGLKNPRAGEFGGSNSDLHVVSNDTNEVLKFDRLTGKFLGVSTSGVAKGYKDPRGLMFSLRPFTFITATPSVITAGEHEDFIPIQVDFYSVRPTTIDQQTTVELVSITDNDPEMDCADIKGASIGKDDRRFFLSPRNDSSSNKVYTITYRISKVNQGSVIAYTTVTVPPTGKTKD